jgi:hypothetical protein
VPYATLTHVHARSPQRAFTATSRPATADVELFLEDAAAELDALLLARGYQLPVPAEATIALGWLRRTNAIGAAAMVEKAAPVSKPDGPSRLQAEWREAQSALANGRVELDAPRNVADSYARGRTLDELGQAGPEPLFSRDMEL